MRYKLLGGTGLRVSELSLGTMTFGEDWGWGAPKSTCRKMFEIYVDQGGNFLDTANGYTNGTSEEIVGELIAGDRDRFVVATKYTLATRRGDPNAGGSHRKNLMAAVDKSLDRLDTGSVDLLWVHAWDPLTPIDELMRGLDDLVRQGKVHHIGFSDAPAWVVAYANALATERGWTPFSAIQIQYNLAERTVERELLPMARQLGLGVTVWSPLAQGLLTGKYLEPGDDRGRYDDTEWEPPEDQLEIARVLHEVAQDAGLPDAQVALAWLKHQGDDLIPILGAREPQHLEENMAAWDIELDQEHLDRLDEATAVELGFPHDFVQDPDIIEGMYGGTLAEIDAGDRLEGLPR